MNFLDLSASLASNSLTLFVGTGLSKHFTDNKVPSWLDLLLECAKRIDTEGNLIKQLFKFDGEKIIGTNQELTICAQIIELEYQKQEKNIREEICEILNEVINEETINMEKVEEFRQLIELNPNINIITTNYDSILSDYVIPEKRRVIIEGTPIARANGEVSIYHIHGSIKKPESIVLTINDYFNFQHNENYFSRKLYTLIQETQMAILGYSLSDFNLNKILNEATNNQTKSLKQSNIYYIAREKVDNLLKRYYLSSYGVDIIEQCSVSDFITGITRNYDTAKRVIVDKAPTLQEMLSGARMYVDDAIKTKGLLERVLLRASLLGISIDDEAFQKFLIRLLKKKKRLTRESNAWEQYTHLAEWLIKMGSYISIGKNLIEDEYLEIVDYSFSNMSKELYIGSSWAAFEVWDSQWENLLSENKNLLLKLMREGRYSSRTGVKYILNKYDKNNSGNS
ncbi:SIR2 family protein [Neobacillus notoginsengisoli]|uniref:SIR2 family protein n=1 Tax=Neobacillus notoginsengisoli TaxID=1578198 RepID=A0A417YZY6_9BACI|nr:SIR2 family protein [Neobacillus notoginsengisoli]RHW43447.1 SIR2 family protein [Neobacillus notoginsengisoli]